LRNALAVIAGIVIGRIVNGAFIAASPLLIAPSAVVDVSNGKSLSEAVQRAAC